MSLNSRRNRPKHGSMGRVGGGRPGPRASRRSVLIMECLEDRLALTAEVEPNNTQATATSFVAPMDLLTGSLSPAADVDVFRVSLGQGDSLRVVPFWIDPADPTGGPNPGQLHFAPAVEILNPGFGIRSQSLDGRELNYVAPRAGDYFVRFSAGSSFGDFQGNYGATTQVASFSGVTESEPNETPATSDPVTNLTAFRGVLSGVDTAGRRDDFSFSGMAGNTLVVRFAGLPAENPSVRLIQPNGTQVAASLDGTGLVATLPVTGTYQLSVRSDNTIQSITWGYVGGIMIVPNTVSENAASDSFEGAPVWNVTTEPSRAVGRLTLGDVDLFAVDLTAGNSYEFSLDTMDNNLFRQSRVLTLYNEYGQALEYSTTGVLTSRTLGFGFRVERTGRHYIGVQAARFTSPMGADTPGQGAYSLQGKQSESFPTRRDVPLFFHDYTGQTAHLTGGTATTPFNAQAVPFMVGMFEARFDVYDVDVTLNQPAANTPNVAFGMGDFPNATSYGLGGRFDLGTRRIRGDSFVDDTGATWAGLASSRFAASVMNQEIGHASGLFAHARHPLSFMSYDSQSALSPPGTYFPFPWTDNSVPDVEMRNERDFLDLVLQAGRIADETEANDSTATAQDLDPFLAEMASDTDPRNDRVTILGRINTTSNLDVDYYRFTAAAGDRFAIDIDSAEFQNPLDARLTLLDANGATLATSTDATDRESGLSSVDPYLTYTFASAGTYFVRVAGDYATAGNYRLKLTPSRAFDAVGPRVIASWPNGNSTQDSTRQLIFWFNDQIDPATIRPDFLTNNVVVTGPSGAVAGSATFDPLDETLVWTANAPLAPGTYQVTLKGGATGLKDMRGNRLDGETGTAMALVWPRVSGDGTPGGDFVTTFTIDAPDTTAAVVTGVSYRPHSYNRGLFTLTLSDELSVTQVNTAGLVLRGMGGDQSFNTADDTLAPLDVLYDKIQATSGRKLYLYTRGFPDVDTYRIEGTLIDAAGNQVVISASEDVTLPDRAYGPSVIDLNVQPNAVNAPFHPLSSIQVTFSGAILTSTLTTGTITLRFSPDPTFFDGNDALLTDADGVIAWDPVYHRATFQPASPLANGYYLLTLNGGTGGIANTSARLLDGEYLDSNIAGTNLSSLWRDAPSGDGLPGGDYRAYFIVRSSSFTVPATPAIAAGITGPAVTTSIAATGSNLPMAIGSGDSIGPVRAPRAAVAESAPLPGQDGRTIGVVTVPSSIPVAASPRLPVLVAGPSPEAADAALARFTSDGIGLPWWREATYVPNQGRGSRTGDRSRIRPRCSSTTR